MAAHLARISGCKKDLNLLVFSTSFMQSPSKTLLWEVLRKRCTLQGSCSKWSWEWKSREVTSETPACSWGSAWSFSTEYQRNNRISEHISTEKHFSDFFFFSMKKENTRWGRICLLPPLFWSQPPGPWQHNSYQTVQWLTWHIQVVQCHQARAWEPEKPESKNAA